MDYSKQLELLEAYMLELGYSLEPNSLISLENKTIYISGSFDRSTYSTIVAKIKQKKGILKSFVTPKIDIVVNAVLDDYNQDYNYEIALDYINEGFDIQIIEREEFLKFLGIQENKHPLSNVRIYILGQPSNELRRLLSTYVKALQYRVVTVLNKQVDYVVICRNYRNDSYFYTYQQLFQQKHQFNVLTEDEFIVLLG